MAQKINTALRSVVARGIADGLTYTRIAELAGCSKSAVAGQVHRMGLTGVLKSPAIKETSPMFNVPNDPPLPNGPQPTPLLDTTGCRWPVEGGFCNHRLHKKSYCRDHFAKAYRARAAVHPLLVLLATKGPQTPPTRQGAQAYNLLVSERLVMFRKNTNGLSTFYLTDAGRENTPGY